MKRDKKYYLKAVATLILASGMIPQWVIASDFNVHGYAREHLSFNLEDPVETSEDDKYDLSMARTTLRLDVDGDVGPIRYSVIGRASREANTSYLKRLTALGAADGDLPEDQYDEEEFREAFVEFDAGDRTLVILGKQQVAWGESDFFQAMDIIHGFDFSWRSFLEVENEELRKPLIMANAIIQVPEADASLQLLVRPGWDRDEDIGTTFDLFGGRWANQPNKGFDFLDAGVVPYNYDHSEGDADDPSYGFRWSAAAGSVDYTFSYWHGFNLEPVVNSIGAPFKSAPINGFAEFIYPIVDTFGVTLSTYSAATDAVWSTEIAYTLDKPFNVGTACFIGIPGFCGIKEKDTLRLMFRMDKQVALSSLIGTSRPSFFSVQLFDTWILGFDKSDDIVDLAGYSAPKEEHNAILTVLLAMNYNNDRINPTLAAGYDLSYGGGFFIPSVEFAWGDHWRLRAEADIFFDDGNNATGGDSSNTHLFGYFANNDQFAVRLTYQF